MTLLGEYILDFPRESAYWRYSSEILCTARSYRNVSLISVQSGNIWHLTFTLFVTILVTLLLITEGAGSEEGEGWDTY
jgi:hypothetical protein